MVLPRPKGSPDKTKEPASYSPRLFQAGFALELAGGERQRLGATDFAGNMSTCAGGSLLLRLVRNLSEPLHAAPMLKNSWPWPTAGNKVRHMRRSISHYLGEALRLFYTAYRHSDYWMLAVFRALAEPRFRYLACSDLRQEPNLEQPGSALGDLSALHLSRSLPSSASRRPRWEAGKAAKRTN